MKTVMVWVLVSVLVPMPAKAQEAFDARLSPRSSMDEAARADASRAWKRSLIPLLASQSLDAASSYGYRELNPVLADADGRFGVKSTTLKFAVVGVVIGVEYLVARKCPRMADLLSKLNWSGSVVTTGFAVHNYMLR